MSVFRINDEYITHVSKKIEGMVIKKLSHKFSNTESRILGGLSKLNEFLLNPQVQIQSGTVLGTSINTDVGNHEPNGDRSRMIVVLEWDPPSTGLIIQLIQTQTTLLPKLINFGGLLLKTQKFYEKTVTTEVSWTLINFYWCFFVLKSGQKFQSNGYPNFGQFGFSSKSWYV